MVTQPVHGRQAAACREVCDLCSVIEEHRVHENNDRTGLLARHPREGAVDLAGTTRLQGLKPHAQGSGRILRPSYLWRVACVGRVPEDGYQGGLGNDLLEHLQLLSGHFGRHAR